MQTNHASSSRSPRPGALTSVLPAARQDREVAFERLADEVPAGLHRLLRNMLESLASIANDRPEGILDKVVVEVNLARVIIGPSSEDPVEYGIQRRFTVQAAQTCHRCGRRGRPRQDLGGRVRCAKCAATPLLLQAIDLAIGSATYVANADRPMRADDVPPLLRPMFRHHLQQQTGLPPEPDDTMNSAMFSEWLRMLRDIANDIRNSGQAAGSEHMI
jgi:hypothetical protein